MAINPPNLNLFKKKIIPNKKNLRHSSKETTCATLRNLPKLLYLLLDPQLKTKIGKTLNLKIIKKNKILLLKIANKDKNGTQNQSKILKINLTKGLIENITKLVFFEVSILCDKRPKAYLKGCKTPINPT